MLFRSPAWAPKQPPYVSVKLVPTDKFTREQPSIHRQSVGSGTPEQPRYWIESVKWDLDRCLRFKSCLTGILLTAVPFLLLVGTPSEAPDPGETPNLPLLFHACAPQGLDARPLLMLIALGLIVALWYRAHRRRRTGVFWLSERSIHIDAARKEWLPGSANTYVTTARSVRAQRRLTRCIMHLVLGGALLAAIVKSPLCQQFKAIIDTRSVIGTCEEALSLKALTANFELPWSPTLYPVFIFLLFGLLLSYALSFYARSGLRSSVDEAGMLRLHERWLKTQLTPHLQRSMLLEQVDGRPSSGASYGAYELVRHWFILAALFPKRTVANQLVANTPNALGTTTHLLERTLFRIAYPPVLAPLLAVLLTPLAIWAQWGEVNKAMYLPSALIAAAWSGSHLSRLAESIVLSHQRHLLVHPEYAALWSSFPDNEDISIGVNRYNAHGLDAKLWIVLTVAFTAAVGWIGAF